MSHFTTIQTQVRDIAALRDACHELGLQVVGDRRKKPEYHKRALTQARQQVGA